MKLARLGMGMIMGTRQETHSEERDPLSLRKDKVVEWFGANLSNGTANSLDGSAIGGAGTNTTSLAYGKSRQLGSTRLE